MLLAVFGLGLAALGIWTRYDEFVPFSWDSAFHTIGIALVGIPGLMAFVSLVVSLFSHEPDFFNCLSSCGLHIIKEDASLIARFIDKDGSDMLNFEEFLFVLRGKPNEERQAIIDYVYSIFDKDHTGVADANEMRKVFNCQKHPKFKMGKLTESQMFYLYLKNFNNQVKMTVTKKVIKFFIII